MQVVLSTLVKHKVQDEQTKLYENTIRSAFIHKTDKTSLP